MDNEQTLQRLKTLEREIQNAQVEVGVRQQQLAELKPKRKALEDECERDFGCGIAELDGLIGRLETELADRVAQIETDLAFAKGEAS
jgi:hypothetical protein